jgi:copper(I)-binding protein
MRIALLAAVAATFLSLHPASAHSEKIGNLELTELWARATPPRAPAAGGFLTITNHGGETDRLIAVSSPVAAIGEIHEMKVEDGVMTMRPLDRGLEIPANETVVLEPGGYHIMLIDLKAPLVEGEDVPVTLTFETAGSIETLLHIVPIGAKAPGAHEGMMQTQ